MRKLMHFLFLSCLKATELIEKKFEKKLSKTETVQLGIHKSMCKACLNYEIQSGLIEESLKNKKLIEKFDTTDLQASILKKLSEE